MGGPKIVVGVDGSAASTAAVKWAATEAWLRDVELEVLMAYEWRTPGLRFTASGELQHAADARATAIVDDAIAEARAISPHLTVRGSPLLGYPAPVLLDVARDSALVVVGHRGRGGFGDLLLGSVSSQVATHASCSVAVVRGRANTAVGPVVVGVDDSPSAQTALGVAFEEAALRRQSRLEVVTAYAAPLAPWTGAPPLAYDADRIEADLKRRLAPQLAGWRDEYPDLAVDHEVVSGGAAAVLVEKSRRAQLIVIGASRRGRLYGLLGSIGQQLLHHADCPVLVARPGGNSDQPGAEPR
jgi:nucleotide-binding universal stress UspA family protein